MEYSRMAGLRVLCQILFPTRRRRCHERTWTVKWHPCVLKTVSWVLDEDINGSHGKSRAQPSTTTCFYTSLCTDWTDKMRLVSVKGAAVNVWSIMFQQMLRGLFISLQMTEFRCFLRWKCSKRHRLVAILPQRELHVRLLLKTGICTMVIRSACLAAQGCRVNHICAPFGKSTHKHS